MEKMPHCPQKMLHQYEPKIRSLKTVLGFSHFLSMYEVITLKHLILL